MLSFNIFWGVLFDYLRTSKPNLLFSLPSGLSLSGSRITAWNKVIVKTYIQGLCCKLPLCRPSGTLPQGRGHIGSLPRTKFPEQQHQTFGLQRDALPYVWMSLLFTLFSAHPCSNNKIMFEYTYSRFCDSQLFADGKLLPHLQNKSYLWDKAGNLFMVVGVQLHVVSVAGVHLQKRIFWKAKKRFFSKTNVRCPQLAKNAENTECPRNCHFWILFVQK